MLNFYRYVECMNDKLGISIIDFSEDKTVSAQYFSNKVIELFKSNPNNSEDFLFQVEQQLSNKVQYHSKNIDVFKDYRGLRIDYNPNKISERVPTENLSYSQFKESTKIVENELREIGINTNIESARIYKYHSSFDVKPKHKYRYFLPTILTLKPQREIRKAEKRIIENTFYFQNKSEQITIYNKQLESNLPFHCIRFEHRKNKIRNEKLHLNDVSEDYYYFAKYESKSRIEDCIFSYDTENKSKSISELLLSLILLNYKPNEIVKYIAAFAVNADLKEIELTINQLTKQIKSRINNNERNPQYTTVSKIKQIIEDYKVLPYDCIEPYRELKQLFQKVS